MPVFWFFSNVSFPQEDSFLSRARATLACVLGESWRSACSRHSHQYGFDGNVHLGFISTILTILEPAFERGGRVKGVVPIFLNESLLKEPIKR